MNKKRIIFELLIPCLLLFAATLVFRLTDWDLLIARLFYSKQGWFLEDIWIVSFLHRFSAVPGIAFSFGALCVFVGGFRSKKLFRFRKKALYSLLVFGVGVGLITNLLLKEHWGRPRPNQTTAFGAAERYLPVWTKGECRTCRSFPCGDAASGFYFCFLFFALRKTSPRAAAGFMLLGVGYGVFLGLCRMARGAHFASDVIWSGGIMYMTCLALYYALKMHRPLAAGSRQRLVPETSINTFPHSMDNDSSPLL